MTVEAHGITANVTEDNVVVLTPQGYVGAETIEREAA